MGVFRMGVRRVVVVVIMRVIMVMMMVMRILRLQTTQPGAKSIAQLTIGHVRPRRAGPLSLDMVVMAFLHRADL